MIYPRYHSNYGKSRHFTLQQALSLNAGRRENLLDDFSSPARKGWVLDALSPVRTNHRLSVNYSCLTVFVKAFFLFANTLTCPHRKVKHFRRLDTTKERKADELKIVQNN